MKKAKIYQFDPVIFPHTLWVIDRFDKELIEENFTYRSGKDIEFDDECDDYIASTTPVTHKGTGIEGSIVTIMNQTHFDAGTIAHESVHVACNIFRDTGMSMGFLSGENEHFAYLTGWIARRLQQVKEGKAKPIRNNSHE